MKTLGENIWYKSVKQFQNLCSLKPAHGSQLLSGWSPGNPDCFIKPLWSGGCPHSSPEAWHALPQTQCSSYREYRLLPEGPRFFPAFRPSHLWVSLPGIPHSGQVPPLQRSVPNFQGRLPQLCVLTLITLLLTLFCDHLFTLVSPSKLQAPVNVPVAQYQEGT